LPRQSTDYANRFFINHFVIGNDGVNIPGYIRHPLLVPGNSIKLPGCLSKKRLANKTGGGEEKK
jgi:hypothetical protein